MELTIGITAHDEGLIAHKTMRSILRALDDTSIKYEIIVHIDNASKATKSYFQRYENDPHFSIYHNNFNDLGAARNFIIEHAKGKYTAFLDADDLVSQNYFSATLDALKQNTEQDVVVHPECCLCFWEGYSTYAFIWHGYPAIDRMEAARLLFSRNRWPSSCAAKTELFKKHPYMLTQHGFGHEDYALNIQLASDGVWHVIAEHTVLFYRQKDFSLMRSNNAKIVTQPYNALFDFKEWQQYPADRFISNSNTKTKLSPKQHLRNLYVRARNNQGINMIVEPFAKVAKKITGKKLISHDLPDWLMQSWRDLSRIELQLYPTPTLLERFDEITYEAETEVSGAYYQLCQSITDYPDYVFIIPWLVAGGADKVILNYLEALKQIHPDWKIAVITTLKADNVWQDKLPDNAYLLDFGNIAAKAKLRDEAKDLLFTRLLIQLKANKLHIVNSLYGYQWVEHHADLVKSQFELYISLFCHDIVPSTQGQGLFDFADPYALRVYPLISKIYTDNEAVIDRLVDYYAFDRKKFKVHYQPVELCSKTAKPTQSNTTEPNKTASDEAHPPLRLLWASRLSAQKNPELLIRIAKKLDPKKAHIDVYGRRCPDCKHLSFPTQTRTITYRGSFNGLHSLNLSQYDLLLYTSHIDGVPNIILESAGAGLPIIASAVGGVSDFITDGETGFLIKDANNEDAYIKIINQLYDNREQLPHIAQQALKLAKDRHSFDSFVDTIRDDF